MDRLSRSSADALRVTCGDFSNDLSLFTESGVVVQWNAVYSCRSVPSPNGPFVVGLRAQAGDATFPLGERTDVVIGRGGSLVSVWDLPFPRNYVQRARDPVAAMRAEPIAGLKALSVPGSGTMVAFRYTNRLRVGWLNDDLSARGELSMLRGLGGHVGRPAIAQDGREIALVHADTPERVGRRAPHLPSKLYALRGRPGEVPSPVGELPTDNTTYAASGSLTSEYSPSVAPLAGGGWVVTWTRGDTETRNAPQEVWLRAYTEGFSPLTPPLRLNDATSGSDPEIVETPRGFLVVWLAGDHGTRVLRTIAGRCTH
jgi:hypothetical protein